METDLKKKDYLIFIREVYQKRIYLLTYKCFIYAVCMVLRGNICFSGFYSDDFHVQGAERREKAVRKRKKQHTHTHSGRFFLALPAHSATWLDIFKKIRRRKEEVFCKKKL